MADKIGQSGVPSRCITHGLRKAAARRLAEAGCSANEIAAITGHATLAEISALHEGRRAENIGEVGHQPAGAQSIRSQSFIRGHGMHPDGG